MIWMALIPMVMAAETAEEAEMQRLRDQMRQYQESGAVEYSDKVYLQMVKLDPEGDYLKDSDHMMGAMASSTRGDIQTTMNRLELCQSTERAVQWRTFLWESTGSVSLKSIPNSEIVFMLGMLTPEQLAAVEFANNSLNNAGQFRGRLPNGAYQYGDSHFVISATGMMTSSGIKSQSKPAKTITLEGWDVLASSNVGTVLLGEGLRPDTGETIPTTTLVNAGISGGIEVDLGDYYTTVLPMVHLSRGDNVNAWTIQPTASFGQSVSEQFNVGLRVFGNVGYMTLVDVDYVKRTMGGGVGLEGRYSIQEMLSAHMFLDGGIMGSHSLVQAFVGLEYRTKVR